MNQYRSGPLLVAKRLFATAIVANGSSEEPFATIACRNCVMLSFGQSIIFTSLFLSMSHNSTSLPKFYSTHRPIPHGMGYASAYCLGMTRSSV